jgi:hypothetical protein
MIPLHLAYKQSHPHPLLHPMVLLFLMIILHMIWLQHLPIVHPPPPPLVSPPHVFEPVSTSNPPPPPPPPLPLLLSPSSNHYLSPSPHVSSSIDPPLPPLPRHVPKYFDALDTMITLGTIDAHIHDIDIETLDSALISTFVSYIGVLDRGSTPGRKDTDAPSSGGGPR